MNSKKYILVTGSTGLIGSAAVKFFSNKNWQVIGVDNNMRAVFFGNEGDTTTVKSQLSQHKNYTHFSFDIRDSESMTTLFQKYPFDVIIHAAAQPSHEWASQHPEEDFSINAVATFNLLSMAKRSNPDSIFIFTSTNKLYGDLPNNLPLIEHEMRYDLPKTHPLYHGISENMSIDQSTKSILGATKTAADIMVQEYGRYYGYKTGIFRFGCLTGPNHAATKLHGFLAFLVKCIKYNNPYTIIGYKGKQVRDNIHADDVITAFWEFIKNPRAGEVYNLGGGRHANTSVLEAIHSVEDITGHKAIIHIQKNERKGDHKWYISDTRKFQAHYPHWKYTYTLSQIIEDLCRKT